MHDWLLLSIEIDWIKSVIKIKLRNLDSEDVFLIANGFKSFKIQKNEDWGESISINNILDFTKLINGNVSLTVEIQSGDQLHIEAEEIILPPNVLAIATEK